MILSTYNEVPEEIAPLDYQKATLKRIDEYFRIQSNHNKSFLVSYPMGAGKSYLISMISILEKGNILILSPSLDINKSIKDKIDYLKKLNFVTQKELLNIDDIDNHHAPKNIIVVDTFQKLHSIYRQHKKGGKNKYDIISKLFKWVLIDEGHREPSPDWSCAIRDLKHRKILFTATPYRNDFNIFDLGKRAIEVKSYSDILETKNRNDKPILRKVKHIQKDWNENDTSSFVEFFTEQFNGVCRKSKLKAIIRCEKYEDIRKIVTELNNKKPNSAAGIHTNFKKSDRSYNLYHSYSECLDVTKENTDVFVHQFKLIEGIDNNRLILLAFFGNLKNGRSVIQQIGRVLRYKIKNEATILSHRNSNIKMTWENYLAFDRDLINHKSFWGIKEFTDEYLSNINNLIYQQKSFKVLFNPQNDTKKIIKNISFSKSIKAFIINDQFKFEVAANEFKESFIGNNVVFNLRKCDLIKSNKNSKTYNIDDFYITGYFSLKNTDIFSDVFFPEIKLDMAGIFKIKDILFYYSTSHRIPHNIQNIDRIRYSSIINLLDKNATCTQASLYNMDISDTSIRQRIIRSNNLNNTLTSNFDYSYFISGILYKNNNKRSYIGIKGSRISEFSANRVNVEDFIYWISTLAQQIKGKKHHNKYLDRFPKELAPKNSYIPKNILIDFNQAEYTTSNDDDKDFLNRVDLQDLNKTYEIKYTNNIYHFDIQLSNNLYHITLTYKDYRYKLSLQSKLNETSEITNTNVIKKLLRILNTMQLFQIVFEGRIGTIYSFGRYFEIGNLGALKNIIIADDLIKNNWSEKGEEIANKSDIKVKTWSQNSLFGYLTDCFNGKHSESDLSIHLKEIMHLACDDRGREIADFIAISNNDGKVKKIILIHCKSKKNKKTRGTAFYDATSQAIKNLIRLSPFNKKKLLPSRFSANRELGQYDVPRLQSKGNPPINSADFVSLYEELCSDPQTVKEVWIVMGGGLSEKQITQSVSNNNAEDHLEHAAFLLYSTWASVSSANALLRIFCPR